jgi:uncharacterized membrane protein
MVDPPEERAWLQEAVALRAMRIVIRDTVRRPAAEVFDRMADLRNEPSWNSRVTRVELLSDEPIAQGSRFVVTNRGRDHETVISVYEPSGRLRFDVSGAQMDLTVTCEFVEASGETSLTETFDVRPKGVLKLLLPLMAPMVKRDMRRETARFASFCESG